MSPGQPRSKQARSRRWAVTLSLLALPFALFYWQAPFLAKLTIGNDYTLFPTRWQQELLFSVRTGTFPLFVPGFAGGHSASALSLGQLFHPQSYLAAISPGYWRGHALDWNTFYRLLSLGATHLVLFRLLRRLRLGALLAGVLGAIAVYNLRMLDWFRYGSSLESYTAFLVTCASIFWCWIRPGRWLPRVGVVLATYCVVVGGHPQVMYYGLLGAGLTTLVTPWYLAAVLEEDRPSWRRAAAFQARTGLMLVAGILLAMAYVAPYYFDFLRDNAERVGREYGWADGFRDSFIGTLNNFFLPLYSSVGGAFGGSSLFLAAALTPLVLLLRIRVPLVVWAIWGIAVLAFVHMQGGRTPVHYLTWKYLPLASSFRIAGRTSTLLPFFLVLLLTWQLRQPAVRRRLLGRDLQLSAAGTCAGLALLATLAYTLLPTTLVREPGFWSATLIREIPGWVHTAVLALGLVALAALLPAARRRDDRGPMALVAGTLLVLATLGQAVLCFRYGTWVEEKLPSITFEELSREKAKRLDFTGDPGHGLFPRVMVDYIKQGASVEPFLAKLYPRHRRVETPTEAFSVNLNGGRDAGTIWLQDAPEFEDGDGRTDLAGSRIELTFATFNRLRFDVDATKAAVLGFGYPWSPRWEATVDGEVTPLYLADGAYEAIRVPAGRSTVELCYRSPAALWGMATSALSLSVLLAVLVVGALSGTRRVILLPLALLIGPAGFFAWRASLRNGATLGTAYSWTAPHDNPRRRNVAYWCRAWTTSLRGPQWKHTLGPGAAVDGMFGQDTGSLTRTEPQPTWTVHLGPPVAIQEVVIREGTERLVRASRRDTYDPFNERPLEVSVSIDYEAWKTIAVITRERTGEPLRLWLDPPVRARFLRIRGKNTRLALDEVEVYAAER